MEKKRNWYTNQRKYHFIYKTTCSVNQKFYYGMHSTDDLDDGYIGSGTYLAKAIRKHGREKFKLEILEFLPSRELLRDREKEFITEEMLHDPMCMNLRLGGDGNNWKHVNEKFTAEQFALRAKNSNLSKKERGIKCFPIICDWSGRNHTEKAKTAIGIANSLKQAGDKNSQFGTCWIYNEQDIKKIKLTSLNEYINLGWKRGRKSVI